jgi:ribosomal protein L40E
VNEDVLRAELALLRAEIELLQAKLAAVDVCWHCQDRLTPTASVCERCPAPGDCDDENCQQEACRDPLRRLPAPTHLI